MFKKLLPTILLTAITACGGARDNNRSKRLHPKLVEQNTAGAAVGVDANADGFFLDAKNLNINLEWTNKEAGSVALPQCFDPFPRQYQIGIINCRTSDVSAPLLAGHVNQICGTQMLEKASKDLTMEGCDNAGLQLFRFDPELHLTR